MTGAPAPDDRPPEGPDDGAPTAAGAEGTGLDGVREVGPDEVGSAEVGSAEVGSGEVGPAEAEEPQERRYPSTIGGAFYLLILVTSAIGFGIVVTGNWRLGVRWLAASLLAASALRLVLPERDAGMLAVRHRFVDCTLLAAVGGALFWLATSIPDQPL